MPAPTPAAAAAASLAPASAPATASAPAPATAALLLAPVPRQQKQKQKPAGPPLPTLRQLGITPQMTRANVKAQERLNRRQWMLRWHQRLGLITGGAMLATFLLGPGAKQRPGRPGSPAWHVGMGAATTALYFTTAYFALAAPKTPGSRPTGAVKLHEILAWVHFPGMILTPILGYMAYHQQNMGQRVHGVAKLHGPVATVTFISFATSIVAVAWPIHLPFHF
ncbi:MAG: hypothetical protein ACRD2E_02355 [Terriglobales bacterium]